MENIQYDKSVDYQARINKAAAQGDYKSAAILERQRNAKIRGEGIRAYSETALYGAWLDKDGGAASAPQYDGEGELARVERAARSLATPFSYDPYSDPAWAAYKKQYLREGDRAAANALGQAAAATGGVPSSYAVTAASQAGNYYASKVADKLPELYQQAYQRYLGDVEQRAGAYNALAEVEERKYRRYRDAYQDWETTGGTL